MSDYFEEPDTQEAQHLFGEILATLKVSESGFKDKLKILFSDWLADVCLKLYRMAKSRPFWCSPLDLSSE